MNTFVPYVILACMVMFWAFLQDSQTVVVTSFVGLVIFGTFWEWVIYGMIRHHRSLAVNKFLEEGDVDRFLRELQEDIEKEKSGYYKNMLLVNKSAGLYYKGEWQQALDILSGLKPTQFPYVFRRLYYNNKLANLLMMNHIQEAERLIAENPKFFAIDPQPKMIDHAMQANKAALAYYQGQFQESRSKFEALLDRDIPKLYKGITRYYLGCLDRKEGKNDRAKERFREAADFAQATFIADKAHKELKSLK